MSSGIKESLRGEVLNLHDIKKDYDSPTGSLPILKGVNLALKTGEMAFILGRSGSGKSTLLHIIGGLDLPTHGKVFFEGEDLTRLNEREIAKIRNQRIGYVFQFYHLIPELTLYENVLLPSLIAGRRDDRWARELLKRMRLLSRKDHYPSELSGGEQQRAALARALVNRPSLVLCDEPTGNLDEETAEEVVSLIQQMNQEDGTSFLIVTHDESLAWRYTCSYRLQDGVLFRYNQKSLDLGNTKLTKDS